MMYIRSQADKRNKLYTIQENSHKGCYKQKSEEFFATHLLFTER